MMKLTVGMGSIEDYEDYAEAGADELFCGFAPERWQLTQGPAAPINRREVSLCNVQLGAMSDLRQLGTLVGDYGVPVTLAFNSISYTKDQILMLQDILGECVHAGFDRVIIADPNLLFALRESGLERCLQIHVSGELGTLNTVYLQALREEIDINRVIFHRQTPVRDMKTMIQKSAAGGSIKEWEGFLMNERCQFTGAYCAGLHTDDMLPVCRERYVLGNTDALQPSQSLREDKGGENISPESASGDLQAYIPGLSGCGLCGLWDLREAGITHLKIVGRGASSEEMIADIRAAKQARSILETSEDKEEYVHVMKTQIFPEGCGKNCYYR